jgi:hypothetical protein
LAEDETKAFMTPRNVIHCYLCPICERKFLTEDEAVQCMETHDELTLMPMYSVGERFPREIIVSRIEGKKITEVATYPRGEVVKVNIEVKES